MTQSTTLLVEAPADLHLMFLDHPTILKYRRKLAALVVERTIASKRDRSEIQEEIDVIHRQIRGRQIRLLKASQEVSGYQAPKPLPVQIDDSVLKLLFPYVNII